MRRRRPSRRPASVVKSLPPVPASPEDLAPILEYPLLNPTFTEEDVHAGCQLARELRLGFVTVRPSDLGLAAKWIQGSETSIGSTVSVPHGEDTTAIKVYAVRDLIQRGARHIETAINLGKMLSRQFQYVELELLQMAQECHRAGAVLIVDLPLSSLGDDHRVIACRIAKRIEADYVRPVPVPAAAALSFLAARLGEIVKLDAGYVATLDEAMAAHAAGAQRMASNDPRALVESWRAEQKKRDAGGQAV
jgi:deoxyribose-phosphate aldolase